jgi:uncharacterized protein
LWQVWLFLALTFVLSWGLGAIYLLFPKPVTAIFGPLSGHSIGFYIAGCAPAISAIILSLLLGGFRGLGHLFGRLLRPFGVRWLCVAALTFPALALLLILVMPHLGGWPVLPRTITVALPLVLFTTAQLFTNSGPLGEELGWRGYALPRLLARWNATTAALFLGAVWVLWHVPAFFIAGALGSSFANFGWWALDTVALSVFMTWIFVNANGNVLVAGMIPHFVINGMGAVGGWLSRPAEACALAAAAVSVILIWGWDLGRPVQRIS